MIMIIAALLVLSAGGGGAWWYLHRAPQDAVPKAAAIKPPLFHSLDAFTVNLVEEGGEHFLQLSVVLQVEDDKAVDQIKTYLPVIRSRMLLLLSAKRPSDLTNSQGKKQLVDELVGAARESLPASTPERGVRGAFLGAFVIQ
ncbi:MAG: flagellar basal body-associated protein FliL [Betaproteobacteria bacterium]